MLDELLDLDLFTEPDEELRLPEDRLTEEEEERLPDERLTETDEFEFVTAPETAFNIEEPMLPERLDFELLLERIELIEREFDSVFRICFDISFEVLETELTVRPELDIVDRVRAEPELPLLRTLLMD